jgi:hypothetical protein
VVARHHAQFGRQPANGLGRDAGDAFGPFRRVVDQALGEQLELEAELEELAAYEARLQEDREQGLEDEVCADCGEDIVQYAAKVGTDWLCAACIHDWTECDRCTHAMRLGDRCDNHCRECGEALTGLGQTNDFCSGDCQYAFNRDDWRFRD